MSATKTAAMSLTEDRRAGGSSELAAVLAGVACGCAPARRGAFVTRDVACHTYFENWLI